jgi:hypothetical protein
MYSGLLVTDNPVVAADLLQFAVQHQLKRLEEAARDSLRRAEIIQSLCGPEAEADMAKRIFDIRKKVFALSMELESSRLRAQALLAAEQELRQAVPVQPVVQAQPEPIPQPIPQPAQADDREERRRRLIEAAERRARGRSKLTRCWHNEMYHPS